MKALSNADFPPVEGCNFILIWIHCLLFIVMKDYSGNGESFVRVGGMVNLILQSLCIHLYMYSSNATYDLRYLHTACFSSAHLLFVVSSYLGTH